MLVRCDDAWVTDGVLDYKGQGLNVQLYIHSFYLSDCDGKVA